MKSKLVGYLFFGVFAAIGIGMLIFKALPMVIDWHKMTSWHAVDARLLSHELRRSYSDDSTTYKAIASYSYNYNKQHFRGNRVGIAGGSDNIGSYHQDMHRKLSRVGDKPFSVWVNPNDPQESIIDRSFRAGLFVFYMFFVLIFGGLGLGGMIYLYVNRRAGEPLVDSDPNKPWTAYQEWLDPIKHSHQAILAYVGIGFAVLWSCLCLAALLTLVHQQEWLYAVIVSPFLLLGCYFLYRSLISRAVNKKLGKMPLSLDPFPASIGGQIGGTIYINKEVQTVPQDTHIEAQCLRKTKSVRNNEIRENKIWHQKVPLNWEVGQYGWQCRFCFNLANDLPVSSPPLSSTGIEWRVLLTAQTEQGRDIKRRYDDIPVFITGEKSSFNNAISQQLEQALEEQNKALVKSVLKLEKDTRGYQMFYPMGRNYFSLIPIFIGILFTVVGFNIPHLAFNIIFPLIGIPCFLTGLYAFGRSIKVRIGAEGISSQRRVFGIALKPKFIPSFEFKKFSPKTSYSMSSGHETTNYFNILAHGNNTQLVVAIDIKTKVAADAAIQRLNAEIKQLGYGA